MTVTLRTGRGELDYTSRNEAILAPTYDFFTTLVFAGYQHSPLGISIMGKKTCLPGKTLIRFITANFGIPEREQKETVERISDAIADTARQLAKNG